jgi:group I intron endonuclease
MSRNMGIYRIVNIVDGKFYLGSSNNLAKREREHIWALRKGNHVNDYLQKAFNKYGEANFKFEVLEYVTNESDLRNVEQKYLDSLKPYIRSIGYNLCEDSRGGGLSGENNPNYQKPMSNEQKLAISKTLKGHLVSDETRKKISKARKGKYAGEKHPMYGKPVPLQRRKRQSEIMKGKFVGEKNPFYGKKHTDEAKIKMGDAHRGKTGAQCPNSIRIVQLTKNGKPIKIFDAMQEAQRETGIWASNIQKCCKGKLKTAGGYKWMYYDDYIKQESKQMALVI